MTIQQWFARAVTAGLMPYSLKNVYGFMNSNGMPSIYDEQTFKFKKAIDDLRGNTFPKFDYDRFTQLRSNGKDLYSLEWRKPTEQDVGRMCWFWSYNFVTCLSKLHTVLSYHACSQNTYIGNSVHACYCLLADHGQLAPTEADFIKVYGE